MLLRVAVLSAALTATLVGNAFAFQTGTIYRSKDGEWMCIDKWGNEIPPSSSGGWTVVAPPRKIGGDCNNQFVIATSSGPKGALIDTAIQAPEPIDAAFARKGYEAWKAHSD